jgi:hypothetical protein
MNRSRLAALLPALALATLSALPCTTAAQTPGAQESVGARRTGSISGIVVTNADQPLAGVTVQISEAGRPSPSNRSASTDDAGRFRISDLPRGVYRISPYAPGYVLNDDESGPRLCRAGDTVRLIMMKGGVITGTVTNQAGEPLIGVKVYPIRVRDKDDHAVHSRQVSPAYEADTDDRGVYRIFNLLPGTYVILAGGRSLYYGGANPYDEDIPTYYPSATRDTAQPVTVRSGEEVGGIAIRYRGERGHAISGTVSGHTGDQTRYAFDVELVNPKTAVTEAHTYGDPRNRRAFAFYGLADGEYVIVAQSNDSDRKTGGIGRARVKVKGADVTGLDVALAPFASMAGTVTSERLGKVEDKPKCDIKRRSLEEVLLSARCEGKACDQSRVNAWRNTYRRSAPQESGEFALTELEANSYRLEVRLPGEDYFVRSITLPASGKNLPPVDAARHPLTVKAGERLDHLVVTIAEGAAAVRGRVTPAKDGTALPDRLRIHLVPASKEAANEVLRFAEARANADGAFVVDNLAPGSYFILAAPLADDEAGDEPARPVAWDATERAALLKQAAAAGFTFDLQPCQRLMDYVLKYTPPAREKETRQALRSRLDLTRGSQRESAKPTATKIIR